MKKNIFQSPQKNRKGFTLLELLVVVMILGILVVIGLRSFMTSQVKARDSKRKSEIEQLTRALELFRNDQGYYPVGNSQGQIMMQSSTDGWLTFEWGEEFIDVNNPDTIYMSKLPRISNAVSFHYQAFARNASGDFVAVTQEGGAIEAQAYQIHTLLENPEDGARLPGVTEYNCGTAARPMSCNFVVLSTNLPDSTITVLEGDPELFSEPTSAPTLYVPSPTQTETAEPTSAPTLVPTKTETLPTPTSSDKIEPSPTSSFSSEEFEPSPTSGYYLH